MIGLNFFEKSSVREAVKTIIISPFEEIDKEFKDSTLSQIATQLFSQYTIYIYPEEYPYSVKEYLAAFYLLAKDYASSMNSDLSSLSFINELDLEKINQIKEEIDKMLEEF